MDLEWILISFRLECFVNTALGIQPPFVTISNQLKGTEL